MKAWMDAALDCAHMAGWYEARADTFRAAANDMEFFEHPIMAQRYREMADNYDASAKRERERQHDNAARARDHYDDIHKRSLEKV